MVDINLLKDTKESEESGKKAPPPPPSISYSSPDRERMTDPTGAPPSGVGVWFKRLVAKEPKPDEPVGFEKLATPGRERPGAGTPPPVTTAPADLFAELDQPVKPKTPRAAAPPPPPPPVPPRRRARQPEPEQFGGGFSVNLLPTEEGATAAPPNTFRNLGLAAGLSVVALAAAFGIIMLLQMNVTSRTTDVQGEIDEIAVTIESLRAKQREALAFADRITVYKSSLAQHIRWSHFFDRLQKYTLQEVVVSGAFRGIAGGTMTIQGTTNDLDTVARQLAVLEGAKDFMTGAVLDSVGAGASSTNPDGFTFSITGSLVPGLFMTSPNEPAADTGGAQ